MKLGFITAICDGMTFEEVVDFAAENGLECLEVACWPQGGAQRNVNEETGLIDRFKKYVLDSSDYFAASAVMMTGNSYGAAQIMKTVRR